MRNSIHLFHSPIENESRLLKETASILRLNLVDKVYIFGYGTAYLPKVEIVDKNRIIYRSPLFPMPAFLLKIRFFKSFCSLINLMLFFSFILLKIRKLRPAYISCHNLFLLPLGKLCKSMTNAVYLYEPHELETERTGLKGSLKKISSWIELHFIYSADKVMTVCEPISDWYRKKYSLDNVYTVRNVPFNPYLENELVRTNILREEFDIPNDHLVFIYQGVLNKLRGTEELVELFKSMPFNKHLVLMGYGSSEEFIKENLRENIHFKPAVSLDRIIDYSSSADVGIFFINHKVSLSYQYCLPNKFFEYLIAGLPIIVSENLTYLTDILIKENIGWSFPLNTSDLRNKIESVTKEEIDHLAKNISDYSSRNAWQFEEQELLNLYS